MAFTLTYLSYPVIWILKLKAPTGANPLSVKVKVTTLLLPAVRGTPLSSQDTMPTLVVAAIESAAVVCPPLFVIVTVRDIAAVLPYGMVPQSIVLGEAERLADPVIVPTVGMLKVVIAYTPIAVVIRSMPMIMIIAGLVSFGIFGIFIFCFPPPLILYGFQAASSKHYTPFHPQDS